MVRSVGDQCVPEGVESSNLGEWRVVSKRRLDDEGSEPFPRPISCVAHLRLEGGKQATNASCLGPFKVIEESKIDKIGVNRDNPRCARLDALGYILARLGIRSDVQTVNSRIFVV